MRRATVIGAVIFSLAFCSARAAERTDCDRTELSHTRLLEVIKSYIKSKGGDPPRFENEKKWEVEVSEIGSDYVVRLSHLPYQPGAWTVYRISCAGKIVDVMAGD